MDKLVKHLCECQISKMACDRRVVLRFRWRRFVCHSGTSNNVAWYELSGALAALAISTLSCLVFSLPLYYLFLSLTLDFPPMI